MFQTQQTKDLKWLYLENDESLESRMFVVRVCKSLKQQWKMSSQGTKGKKPLKESVANPKLSSSMTQANPKFVMGKPMLTIDALHKAGQPCVELHNYYINNYKSDQDIIVSYKNCHFLVGDDFFLISFSDLYDFFNLNVLDVSLMHCLAL
jgi:hypothetical protein